jgi:PilZ domain-containing protein
MSLMDGRKSRRRDISSDGMIYDADGNAVMACSLCNVSATGARLQLSQPLPLPKSFVLALTADGKVRRLCKPVWQRAVVAGIRFVAETEHLDGAGGPSWWRLYMQQRTKAEEPGKVG